MKTLSSTDDLASVRKRIALIGPTDSPLWGSMSAPQMICHLRDAFQCPLGERVPAPFKASRLPVPAYKWLALSLPMKWPKGVQTPPEMDQRIGGTPPADFEADRAALLTKLDRFVQAAGPWVPHPIFGVLTRDEWMRWGYLHVGHHLRQFGR
jgi:Protein of unknown function (DUF1569)